MLHVHNGDSTAETAKKTNLLGEHLAWREALVCGPTPGHLSEQDFLKVRAAHLAESYGAQHEKCEAELRAQHQALRKFSDHEEVVLWFEHDLFCQVQLIYLLDWFAQRELGHTKLSLICIDDFPGFEIFHGLGQLNEAQLSSLFPERHEVTAAQMQLGSDAWRAYAAPDALGLIALLKTEMSALPFLETALRKHLQRFPSTRNGLGRVENTGLELIAAGYRRFKSLFPAFMRNEREYGFGDAQLYLELKRLAKAPTPLLRNGGNTTLDPARILLSSFELTPHGAAALAGEEDFVVQNGIDEWLGGIHLKGSEAAWRWDDDTQQLLVSL
ncbi:MAG TPA: hypothetical protein VEL78_00430 [Pyrinomonadaceae bacterium]|nr:hypothetical protein [Pyrinomonadaceae bacterium]